MAKRTFPTKDGESGTPILPVMAVDLVDLLEEVYAPTAPSETDSDRRIWMNAGRQELIAELVQMRENTRTPS